MLGSKYWVIASHSCWALSRTEAPGFALRCYSECLLLNAGTYIETCLTSVFRELSPELLVANVLVSPHTVLSVSASLPCDLLGLLAIAAPCVPAQVDNIVTDSNACIRQ